MHTFFRVGNIPYHVNWCTILVFHNSGLTKGFRLIIEKFFQNIASYKMVWMSSHFESTLLGQQRRYKDTGYITILVQPRMQCRSIFSLNSGSHLLYTILWLPRPLIKNILDSPTQYLANATFGTSLAFQMREEIGLKLIFFCIFDLHLVEVKNAKSYFCLTSSPPTSEMQDLFRRWHLQDIG